MGETAGILDFLDINFKWKIKNGENDILFLDKLFIFFNLPKFANFCLLLGWNLCKTPEEAWNTRNAIIPE